MCTYPPHTKAYATLDQLNQKFNTAQRHLYFIKTPHCDPNCTARLETSTLEDVKETLRTGNVAQWQSTCLACMREALGLIPNSVKKEI
jgi:hypothetical protein